MNTRIICTICLLIALPLANSNSMAAALDLHDGFTMLNQPSVSNPDYVKGLVLDNLVPINNSNKNGFPVAYMLDTAGSNYYLLRSGLDIYELNLDQKTFIASWKLARTADDSQRKIAELSAANERDQDGTEYDIQMGSENTQTLGCLWNYPLRYGDVDGDGQTELVLLPGKNNPGEGADSRLDFLVFSLQSHSVIFSIRLAREAVGGTIAEYDPNYKQKNDYNQFPQFIDADGYSETDAAMRYYAKLYFGDFNGNGKSDIVAWRKRYDSRLVGDPVHGYKLTTELLTLYELDNGVYRAQSIDEATIKSWLMAKGLTWQKGYPQTSECAGQTGKPIPEMVDPLLNDPDVLK